MKSQRCDKSKICLSPAHVINSVVAGGGFMLSNSSRIEAEEIPLSSCWHYLKHVRGHCTGNESGNGMHRLELLK